MTPPSSESPLRSGGTGIELGPHLPMSAYDARERWNPERIGAVALYCSDGRWGDAFDEFCHRRLEIPRYDRWALPGGPAWLAMREDEPDLHRAVCTQLDFLVQSHQLERVVLITHYGCAWYGQRLQRSPDECLPAQTADVQAAASALLDSHPSLVVEAYLAMRQEESISFHQLEIGDGSRARRTRRSP
ncbi:MAG: hypothetical protein WD069_01005 [Planctomycetales bacterium]